MNVKGMYQELLGTSLLLNFFDALLTGGAVFCFGYFITYFYRLSYMFAVALAGVIFIISLVRRIKKNKILMLEQSYPELHERLRTSYEYQGQHNTIIDDLHKDIMNLMKKVDINAFLSSKEILGRVFIIVLLLSATLYMSAAGFDFYTVKNGITNSPLFRRATGIADMIDEKRQEVQNRPTLDKPRLVTVGDKDVNISITAYNTELTNEVTDPTKNDYGGHYPAEITGAAQQTYDEKIPEEYKDAVKEYFKKINNQ